MRVIIANDGFNDAGGVQVYLDAVVKALEARGHSLAIAYCTDSGGETGANAFRELDRFQVMGPRADQQFDAIKKWAPDLCYSHNMRQVAVDARLLGLGPVVKFMHGYFGTCISGQKMHAFPSPVVCDRVCGPACLALYFVRRCGRLSLTTLAGEWREAGSAHALLNKYAAIVVGSTHMRREYLRHGSERVLVNPLFPTQVPVSSIPPAPDEPHVAFLGRMTRLKGGDLLIRAVRHATSRLGRSIRLTMIGDGPQREHWQAMARELSVTCTFTNWMHGAARWDLLASASVVAVPSVWPEPFGLVGLEAGALGVTAIAHDVGGISEWLRDGVNGVAVRSPATPESFGEALASLLADRDQLTALRKGAHRVAQEMTLDAHVDRLEEIFESVVGEKARH